MPPVWPNILTELEACRHCALISVLNAKGSTPREQGARMVVTLAGTIGTIGGGELEHRAIRAAQKALIEKPDTYWSAEYPLGPELGQCCGGHVTLLTEVFSPGRKNGIAPLAQAELEGRFHVNSTITIDRITRRLSSENQSTQDTLIKIEPGTVRAETFGTHKTQLAIFGCGHVAKALMLALAPLPFQVTLFDQREHVFPKHVPANINRRTSSNPVAEIDALPGGTQILIMTHDHALDLRLAHAALSAERFSYIGLIGSETKKARFLKRLREAGLNDAQLGALVSPIGVPGLKSKEPPQIASSVATQLLIYRQQA